MFWFLAALISTASAGGGPQDVLVLWNSDDPEAAGTADYYAYARSIPAGQLCEVSGVDPAADSISFDDFDLLIRAPLDACLAALPDPDEIDYVVIVKGLPYTVSLPSFVASLDMVISLGHATRPGGTEIAGEGQNGNSASVENPLYTAGNCTDFTVYNQYSYWYSSACALAEMDALPVSFNRHQAEVDAGNDFTGALFAVTRLDGFDHADARALVDRSLAADDSLPSAEILCMAAADSARGARDPECEYVTRLLDADGLNATWLPAFDGALSGHEVAAYLTGSAGLRDAIDGQTYVPGAIACNLTSYGAVPANFRCDAKGAQCPASESQTSIARYVRAGATGAHGTAAEPLNNTFPNAGLLLLYTSGYNLAESFFLSTRFLYWQNVVLGDPLATPYALRPVVQIESDPEVDGAVTVTATHPDGVADLWLYLDGALVAEAENDTLVWEHGLPADSELPLLAVARSKIWEVQRTGWPVPSQNIRARPQGWSSDTLVVVAAPDPDDVDPPPDSSVSEKPKGCGCDHSPAPGLAMVPLLGLALTRRRRSRRADTP